eukprot:10382419-Prorocentrum_lima.AAC.1
MPHPGSLRSHPRLAGSSNARGKTDNLRTFTSNGERLISTMGGGDFAVLVVRDSHGKHGWSLQRLLPEGSPPVVEGDQTVPVKEPR